MSVAFVAVEYVKSYTNILCEKLFKFHEFVKLSFKECREILTDRETLDHLSPVEVGGKSTNSVIEEAKRKNESLTKEIDNTENKKKEEVAIVCQSRSMSSMCFFLFLFDVLLLFFGGMESSHQAFSHVCVVISCTFILLYVIIGWCIGESEKPKKFCDFSSLRHASTAFAIIIVLSIISTIVIIQFDDAISFIDTFWNYFVVFGVLCPYINFIVFIFKIWSKANGFKRNINDSKEQLKKKCQEAKKDEDDLLATVRIEAKLKTD